MDHYRFKTKIGKRLRKIKPLGKMLKYYKKCFIKNYQTKLKLKTADYVPVNPYILLKHLKMLKTPQKSKIVRITQLAMFEQFRSIILHE